MMILTILTSLILTIKVIGETAAQVGRAGQITMQLQGGPTSVFANAGDRPFVAEAQPDMAFQGFDAATFTAVATSYRGYEFIGFTVGEKDYGPTIEAGELQGDDVTLTANYRTVAHPGKTLWLDYSDDHQDAYRLPALVQTKGGRILAFADYRPGNTDVGGGPTSIELRYSDDNGITWSAPQRVAQGNWSNSARNYLEYSFGDAAVVADHTRGHDGREVLMCCAGGNKFWPYSFYNPDDQVQQLGCALWRSMDGGLTWGSYTNIMPQLMQAFVDAGLSRFGVDAKEAGVVRAFFSSGKITQSTRRARGARYNRIYAALVVNGGNIVVYSDDFGRSWAVLGNQIANEGDEAHLVELPDGDLLLVGKSWGASRWVNVFNYSNFNKAVGQWGERGKWNNALTTSCHGDVEVVQAYDNDGRRHTLIVETSPTSSKPQRHNIQYYWVAIPKRKGFTTDDFAINGSQQVSWTEGMNVTPHLAAYSSLLNRGNGQIDILFEECPAGENSCPTGYCLEYQQHTISQITAGKFHSRKP